MEFPTVTCVNWTSPFPFQGLVGISFHFYSKLKRSFCEPIVEIQIRRRVLWRLIWVCTVPLCPTKSTLGLYSLRKTKLYATRTTAKQHKVSFK